MSFKIPKISSNEITSESVFDQRRALMKAGLVGATSLMIPSAFAHLGKINPEMSVDLKHTSYKRVTTYNNFYELGTDKSDPARNRKWMDKALKKYDPWTIEVSGEVKNPGKIGMEELLKFPLEERVYRFRCVERWSMVVPWNGFELRHLINQFQPTSKAKYVRFSTIYDPKVLRGQRYPVLKWPYHEGLRMDEAMHPLTILAVGLYGKELLPQNGAPIRLVVPWKYGFKSIKSINKIHFMEEMPKTAWNEAAPSEYGFYSNVNPDVHHPRWLQSRERPLGSFGKVNTLPFNGYREQVADLYEGMNLTKYY